MSCPSQKRGYPTEVIAEEALIQARIRFEFNNAIGVYQCDDCSEWHITSKGEPNQRLQELLRSGSIKKERDVMHWNRKLK